MLTAIAFCFKKKSSTMFFSLVVVSLFVVSCRADSGLDPDDSDLDPNNEGEDEMQLAVVSLGFK